MKRILLLVLVTLAAISGHVHAQSGVAGQSANIFNSMTNTTDPKVVMGARRGVITGGSFQMKNRMMDVQLISMNAPNVTGGCGGIDAFMGSFSFISKDQIVAALRSIASAAVGYAFKLALQSMCPSCEKIMGEMQNMMNNVTMNNINSCEVGQSIINAGGDDSIAHGIESMGAPVRTWLGQADDYQASKNLNKSTTPLGSLANQSPQIFDQVIPGNVVWRALMSQGVGTWVGQQNDQMLEDIMSLTGTIIVCMPDAAQSECSVAGATGSRVGQQGSLIQYRQPPTMTIKELVEGTDGSRMIKRIQCVGQHPHEVNGCNRIIVQDYSNYEGLRTKLMKVFLGDGSEGSGMLDQVYLGQRAPTTQEQALMTGGGQYTQLAISLAMKSPAAAKRFVAQFGDLIAAELAREIVFINIDSALTAVAQQTSGDTGPIRQLLQESLQRNQEELSLYYDNAKSKSAVINYWSEIQHALEKRDPVQRPVGAVN